MLKKFQWIWLTALSLHLCASNYSADAGNSRLRLIIETDAGGDPDDEQSLVRFLLYVNEWDVEGIIANRAAARDGENRNRERTGPGIVRRLMRAYGDCYTNLVEHDQRYPKPEFLLERTVPGYNEVDEGVKLVMDAVDREDPRREHVDDVGPLLFSQPGGDGPGRPLVVRLPPGPAEPADA